jgi:hypothetical protein
VLWFGWVVRRYDVEVEFCLGEAAEKGECRFKSKSASETKTGSGAG